MILCKSIQHGTLNLEQYKKKKLVKVETNWKYQHEPTFLFKKKLFFDFTRPPHMLMWNGILL